MTTRSRASFSCSGLTVSVPGRILVEDLNLSLNAGDFIAVLGQNGTGKSLTLQTLAGLRDVEKGEVCIADVSITGMSRQDVARRLALLPQYVDDVFPATVFDTVLIGRHPHIGRFRWESDADRRFALHALKQVDLADMASRDIDTLSGGERRRLAIAQVLAQEPEIFLLDEPTNHLDPQHQLDVLGLFRRKTQDGAVVVAALHDVNLAARYADQCLLLSGDGDWRLGDTGSVLNSEILSALYATGMEAVRWRDRDLFVAVR